MGLSYFPLERNGGAWEEATQVRHSRLSFPFLRASVFQKQKFTEAELWVCMKQQSPFPSPWRVSAGWHDALG